MQMKSNTPKLAVVILTKNEEIHIERALKALAPLTPEVFVIDSFSTDRTVEIARANGATVLQHKFVNYSKQFQWGLDHIDTDAAWIMRLDADEVIHRPLAEELSNLMSSLPISVVGISMPRRHIFMGRWIRYGGRYPLVLLRVWRRGCGRIEDRWMDEHIIVEGGQTVRCRNFFSDENLNDLGFFTDKHNRYASREAVDVINQRLGLLPRDELRGGEGSAQAAFKRLVKEKIYNGIPFEIAATLYFLFRMIFQLGFLDGRAGLIYHFLQGFWYRFLVGAKVLEFERAIGNERAPERVIPMLAKLTGLQLIATPTRAGELEE
jgi:glycosyltransferase involved in cell wall biosynthesis